MSIASDLSERLLTKERARGRRLAFEMDAPRVSAHAGREVAEQLRAQIARKRAELQERGSCSAECPAAQLFFGRQGITVRCGVERSLVTEEESPSSLVNFCLAPAGMNEGYAACPSWRAEKEREWHGSRSPLVAAHEGP